MRFRVHFYRTVGGRCQPCDYARALSVEHQAKTKRWFIALAETGQGLPVDYGKHLRDGVWELRVIIQHHQHRFLYSFWKDIVIVTNAFLKKSKAVPPKEIEKSRKAMADWISRRGWENL
jgi:phage-related protein